MTEPTTPSIGDLINSGVEYAKSSKAAPPYIALATIGAISPLLGQILGALVALAAAIALLFLVLIASREVITGEFVMRDSDKRSAAMLLGGAVVLVIALIVVSIPFAYMLASTATGAFIFNLLMLAIVVAAIARVAFAPAAMSVGDPVSIASLLSQSAPYWVVLILLILLMALPSFVFTVLFASSGGLVGFIVQLIGGVISGVTGIIAIAAIARLYVQVVRG